MVRPSFSRWNENTRSVESDKVIKNDKEIVIVLNDVHPNVY